MVARPAWMTRATAPAVAPGPAARGGRRVRPAGSRAAWRTRATAPAERPEPGVTPAARAADYRAGPRGERPLPSDARPLSAPRPRTARCRACLRPGTGPRARKPRRAWV